MWAQACELIAQAERMHQPVLQALVLGSRADVWEPPVDVFEDEREVVIVVAMPGVPAERVEVTQRAAACWWFAADGPCRWPIHSTRSGNSRFPTDTSSVAFALPDVRLESGTHQLANGCLVLRLHKGN